MQLRSTMSNAYFDRDFLDSEGEDYGQTTSTITKEILTITVNVHYNFMFHWSRITILRFFKFALLFVSVFLDVLIEIVYAQALGELGFWLIGWETNMRVSWCR